MENINKNTNWYNNKAIIIPLILIFTLAGLWYFNRSNSNTSNNNTSTIKNKEGDSLSSISRKDIEDKYLIEKKKSKEKGKEYLDTLLGKEIEWIGRVDKFDINPINNKQFINIKMGSLYIKVYDKSDTYTSIAKEMLVTVKGKIDNLVELNGVEIYIEPVGIKKI
jgi:hypothetical protein